MLSILTILLFNGCVVALVAVGAGALSSKDKGGPYTFSEGEMKSVETTTTDKAWSALEKTAKDMRFTIDSQSHDASSGAIEAHDSEGKKINITFKTVTDKTVEVKIKVGLSGDEKYSHKILKALRKNISAGK